MKTEEKACRCGVEGNPESERQLADILAKYAGQPGATVPLLQEIQNTFGYLSQANLRAVADAVGASLGQIYGVATFYKQFRLAPPGKHLVKICHGTACHVSGAEMISTAIEGDLDLDDNGNTPDLLFTVEPVACLGCCSLAPVLMVDDEAHGRLTPDKAKKVIAKYGQSKK